MSRKAAAIQLQLRNANTALAEAKLLMQGNFYDGAVSRTYYACYHATSALLLTKDLTPKTHKGTKSELHKHFVLEGTFDRKQAQFYSTLLEERLTSDYNSFVSVTQERTEQLFSLAKIYINYITSLLTSP
jgi:uncharacterized protein (UPF0332 family)